MSPVFGTATPPSTTSTRAVRQPPLGLAQPVELQRRGADDDRRVGVVGLHRRRAPGRSCPGPARRRGTRGARRAGSGTPAHWNGCSSPPSARRRPRSAAPSVALERLICAWASAASSRRSSSAASAGASTSTPCSARKPSRWWTTHGSSGSERPPSDVARQALEGVADRRVPQRLQQERLALDRDVERPAAPAAPRRRAPAPGRSASRRRRASRRAPRRAPRRPRASAARAACPRARPTPSTTPRAPCPARVSRTHQPLPS